MAQPSASEPTVGQFAAPQDAESEMKMFQRRFISMWTALVIFIAAVEIRAQAPTDTVQVEWKAAPRSTETIDDTTNKAPSNPIQIVKPDVTDPEVAPAQVVTPTAAAAPTVSPAPTAVAAPLAAPAPTPAPLYSPYRPAVTTSDPAPQPPPGKGQGAGVPLIQITTSDPAPQPPPCPPEAAHALFDAPVHSPARVWGSAEYLGWWLRGNGMPPLVTTAPIGTFGTLDNPSTRTLYGNQETGTDMMSGIRARLGFWIDPCATCGIEASFFGFETNNQQFQASSNGDPGLFRPFFNTSTNAPDAELVALQLPKSAGGFDPILTGTVSVSNSTEFYGWDANFREALCGDQCYRLDALIGYRYLRLRDQTSIAENLVSTDPLEVAAPLGTQIFVLDQFETINTFNGGQLGLEGERTWGRWVGGLRATVALGNTHEEVKINGVTDITVPGSPTAAYRGGLLALPSNIGSYSANVFSVVPEISATLGYQITPNFRVFAGYSFLYWSNVARSGQQIDLVVNPTLLPNNGPQIGPNRPAFQRVETDFWAQGFNVGIDLRW
jgi:Putative beta barrel porin-7 (BBP7)